jgi:hypothetical protein
MGPTAVGSPLVLGVGWHVPGVVINCATIVYPSLTADAPEVVRRMHDITLGRYHRSVAWHWLLVDDQDIPRYNRETSLHRRGAGVRRGGLSEIVFVMGDRLRMSARGVGHSHLRSGNRPSALKRPIVLVH